MLKELILASLLASSGIQSIHADVLSELAHSLNLDIEGRGGRSTAKYLCEAETDCGGLLFHSRPRQTYDDDTSEEMEEVEYTRMFTVPLHFNEDDPNVFISTKPWLIQRGAVSIAAHEIGSSVIHTAKDLTIEQARHWCEKTPDCIAFSFPLQSKKSLITIDEVVFVNKISGFDYGPEQYVDVDVDIDKKNNIKKTKIQNKRENKIFVPEVEYITHVIHDRKRLIGRIPKMIDLEQSMWADESHTPYRPCCSASAILPTMDELKESDTLERVDCNISRQEFFEKYEKQRKPVMLVGCAKDWAATEKWSSFDKIQSRFENDSKWEFQSITRDQETDEIIPSIQKTGAKITWKEFQDFYKQMKEDPDHGSIGMFRKLEVGEYVTDELRKDYTPPKVFDGANIYAKTPLYDEHWFPKNFGLMGYFIMGSYGTGTGPHADPLTTDAWSTLLTGHKWWLIYPKLPGVIDQEETQCSRTCSDTRSESGSFHGTGSAETIAWYASVAKHANKFYYGNGEHTRHVLQKPGETIYVPHGMVHSVLNLEETIAITEKFASEANLEEVWREILTTGEEYDWPHLYYKVFTGQQRERVRKVLWPITKESIAKVTDNTLLYTRREAVKSWVKYDDEDSDEGSDEDYDEEPEELIRLTMDEFDALSINDKHLYLYELSDYLDFDAPLVKPSEYSRMTEEEKEEYEAEMRWMASPDFETLIYYEQLTEDEVTALSDEEKVKFVELMEE